MKRLIKKDSTDQSIDIFIPDSSSSVGEGLTGLVYNSAGLTCYYRRGATGSATQLTLATQTVGGAHADGGFVEIDATNMKGHYRLDLSDAMVATGVSTVKLQLRGATNMAPVNVELQLVDFDPEDAAALGLSNLNAAVSTLATATNLATVDSVVDAIKAVTDLLPNSGALNDLATLATRLSAVRAGYLDNLNTGGLVAVPGDQMDLVNAPNATAIAAIQSGLGTAANQTSIASNVAAILTQTGTTGVVVADKTGFKLAADGIDAVVIETGLNARQAMSVVAAAVCGIAAGAATTTMTFKAAEEGSTTRITATVDADGNRSAVTLVLPS